jgi:S-adenosylmethionine:tRNA ribosyltransferase-isomerase
VKTADFDYDLPPEFIAQTPIEPRDASRLLIMDRARGTLHHAVFADLPRFLDAGDLLVFNDTRVIPARLFARKAETGGRVELLMLKRHAPLTWEVLAGGKGLHAGSALNVEGDAELRAVVMQAFEGARRLVQFSKPITPLLEKVGHVPLPPYIHAALDEPDRYQTVYARIPGSAAAPTAGLHFTPGLLERLHQAGVELAYVTLHVGLDTFQPVTEDDPAEHGMHGEWCEVPTDTAARINSARRAGRRVIAVGTTTVRTLETAHRAAEPGQVIGAFEGATELYILPGHRFGAVDAMITNFHLPRSTLLMLVSAFAGRERVLEAYEVAKREGYRFYSFGDAMLIA